MELKRIKTRKDYLKAMERFEEIFQAKKGSKESDEADVLALIVKDYEDIQFVIDSPSPLEAIKYRMDQQGLTKKDLADILGYKSRVSDIFHKTRKLNLDMIRRIYQELHIPLETLVKPY